MRELVAHSLMQRLNSNLRGRHDTRSLQQRQKRPDDTGEQRRAVVGAEVRLHTEHAARLQSGLASDGPQPRAQR